VVAPAPMNIGIETHFIVLFAIQLLKYISRKDANFKYKAARFCHNYFLSDGDRQTKKIPPLTEAGKLLIINF
jgi:hypothetical protein